MNYQKMLWVVLIIILPLAAIAQPGFDPPLDRRIEFPDTPVDETSVHELMITGRGNNWLIILQSNRDEFSIAPNFAEVGPREAVEVEVRFTPRREGVVNGELYVAVIGENGDSLEIFTEMIGRGVGEDEPEIRVRPLELTFEVDREDDLPSAVLTIENLADAGVLEWEFENPQVNWLDFEPGSGDIEPEDEAEVRLSVTNDFPEENGDYNTEIVITSNDPENESVTIDVTLIVDISEEALLIDLPRGWNMISSNRDFADEFLDQEGLPDMRRILSDIEDDVILIKNGSGRFCAPQAGYWGIRNWNTADGYQIKVQEATELEIYGRQIPFDRPIDVRRGWNLIAYYPDYSLRVDEAFTDLVDRELLYLAKDGNGRFYVPRIGFGEWDMFPGQGYQVCVYEDCRFSYPAERDENDALPAEPTVDLEYFPQPLNTGINMSILVDNIDGIDLTVGSEIACVTPEGLVAGAEVIEEGMPPLGMAVWGNDELTDEIDGFEGGEPLRFIYWDSENNWELEIDVTEADGELRYEANVLLTLGMMVDVTESPEPPYQFDFSGPYPNPFNGRTQVQFTLTDRSRVTVGLYDLSGRLLRQLSQGEMDAGNHRLDIDASDMPSGMYLVILDAGDHREVIRAVLMR
ncbi:MAG: T9SS type A sorting domain-containing protein [Candidatus Electryoneaceae bacterium]|nr:T9SS type A sorting domain-containing protein [Candidatus Electryoneaceae bacterium]